MNKTTRQRSLRCVHLREEHERSNDPRSSLSPEQSRHRAGIKMDAFDGHDISGLVSIFRCGRYKPPPRWSDWMCYQIKKSRPPASRMRVLCGFFLHSTRSRHDTDGTAMPTGQFGVKYPFALAAQHRCRWVKCANGIRPTL